MKEPFRKRPQVNNGRLWSLLALVVGLALGVTAGFLLHQTGVGSAAPWQLSPAYQERLVNLAALEYAANGDADYVSWVLEGWDREKLAALLADMEANAETTEKEQRLATMREALDMPSAQPSFRQLVRRQPMIILLGLSAGVVLLLAGVLSIFLATEEDRVRQALEQAIFVHAQANAAVSNSPPPSTTGAVGKYQEQLPVLTLDSGFDNGENEGWSARPSKMEPSETQPGQSVQSAPQPVQGTGESPQAATLAGTRPAAAQPAQPAASKQEGQPPQQPGQTAAPQPQEPPKPLVEESELSTGGTIEDLVADVFDDSEEQLHQQAVLKGLGTVDINELVTLLQKVKTELHTGKRRIAGAGKAEIHKPEIVT